MGKLNETYNEHIRTLTEKVINQPNRTAFLERIKHIMIDVRKYALIIHGEIEDNDEREKRKIYSIVVEEKQLTELDEKDIATIELDILMWLFHEEIGDIILEIEDDTEFAFLQKDDTEHPHIMFDSAKFPPQILLIELYKYYESIQKPTSFEDLLPLLEKCAQSVTIDELKRETKNPEQN